MSSEDDNPNDRDALIRDAWRRLTRLEMEAHRIRAMLARMEAMDQDRAADALARLLAEYPDDRGFASALTSYVGEPPSAARGAGAVEANAVPPALPPALTPAVPPPLPPPAPQSHVS